jgi:hypothetical protein
VFDRVWPQNVEVEVLPGIRGSTWCHHGVCNDHVKTTLFETYWQEYKNFVQLAREAIDMMFSRFRMILSKLRSNKAHLPHNDHERELNLINALDQRVWEVKVSSIKSPKYDTLTVDELFNKLKSTKIDHKTQAKIENLGASTIALVSRGGSAASNPSNTLIALSSLLSIIEGFRRSVNLKTGKFSGLKSHEYHIIMERLLPVIFCGQSVHVVSQQLP